MLIPTMKLSFFAAVLLLISAKIAVAGPKQYTTQQITQAPGSVLSLKGPSQTTSTEIGLHGHLNATRSLRSLFRRDPDFEFAMGILGKDLNCYYVTLTFLMNHDSPKYESCERDRRSNHRRYQTWNSWPPDRTSSYCYKADCQES